MDTGVGNPEERQKGDSLWLLRYQGSNYEHGAKGDHIFMLLGK